MTGGTRKAMAAVHSWVGVLAGWLLFFMFVTGTAGYVAPQLDRWMTPEQPLATHVPGNAEAVALAMAYLDRHAPETGRWRIEPPNANADTGVRVQWSDGPRTPREERLLDPETGAPIEHRATGGGTGLYRMHYRLRYLPDTLARWLTGLAALAMAVGLVAGTVIHRRLFRDAFKFRPGRGALSWMDAHKLLGTVALPFHFLITYTGLVMLGFTYMAGVIALGYGPGAENQRAFFDEVIGGVRGVEAAGAPEALTAVAPLLQDAEARWDAGQVRRVDVHHPGDAAARIVVTRTHQVPVGGREQLVYDGVTGELASHRQPVETASDGLRGTLRRLHQGDFGPPFVRAFYVLFGLAASGMIATGLVLWAVKRQARSPEAGVTGLAHRAMAWINVAVLAGLPGAIAVYLIANRLIPVDWPQRAEWELHALFLTWALAVGHALLRQKARLWPEQLGAGAALWALVPLINAATTDRHLGITIAQGDWALAGVDMAALVIAAALGMAGLAAGEPVARAHAGKTLETISERGQPQ